MDWAESRQAGKKYFPKNDLNRAKTDFLSKFQGCRTIQGMAEPEKIQPGAEEITITKTFQGYFLKID